jgi:hypothetical protein
MGQVDGEDVDEEAYGTTILPGLKYYDSGGESRSLGGVRIGNRQA